MKTPNKIESDLINNEDFCNYIKSVSPDIINVKIKNNKVIIQIKGKLEMSNYKTRLVDSNALEKAEDKYEAKHNIKLSIYEILTKSNDKHIQTESIFEFVVNNIDMINKSIKLFNNET